MPTTIATVFTALSMLAFAAHAANEQGTADARELDALTTGIDAYIYGDPLVTMELTRRVSTNVAAPEARKAPMGQFAKASTYPDASYKTVTAPNADTLYTQAWVDVSKEPWTVGIPDLKGRYALFPLLDGWTEVFALRQAPRARVGQGRSGDRREDSGS